jgi:Protein of unknown function (DUF1266)
MARLRQMRHLVSAVLTAPLILSSYGHTADPPPAAGHADPAPATGFPDSAATQRAMASSVPVMPKSPHAWALATTAIIFEVNRHRHDLLSGTAATPDGEEIGKHVLSQWWGISNHDELIKMLSWLQFEGHRAEFDQLGRRVDALSEREFRSIEAATDISPQTKNQLDIARKNHRALGQEGILAWDLVRYIALCRWGYLAGYLSDAEAWDHIMPAALRLQRSFASWQDLQSDYLIGREYWSVQQTENNGARYRAIYERFLQDPSGPWNTNPWIMDLNVAAPLPIEAN